jgi:hypothetical protein
MVVARPNAPLKILAGDKPRPTFKHTPRMTAHGCRLAVCFLDVQLVNI